MLLAVISNARFKTRKEWISNYLKLRNTYRNEATVFLGWPGLNPSDIVREINHPIYLVTGPRDDIIITKQGRKLGILMDGKIILHDDTSLAGIGGIDPHQNIELLRKGLKDHQRIDILLSYFPPKGCGDIVPHFHVRRGLNEILQAIRELKPKITVTSGRKAEECRLDNHTTTLTLSENLNAVIIDTETLKIIKRFRVPLP